MAATGYALRGYQDVLRGLRDADKDSRRKIRAEFREVGRIVQRSATERFSAIDQRSAAGFKTVVRLRGVSVEQSLKRTTGKRPDYGSLQMRKALIPAAIGKQDDLERGIEHALDVVADHFNRGGSIR